jgi:uncharacterized protein YndB with AHSA1/START domain
VVVSIDVNRSAPVIAQAETVIAAPAAEVWAVLTDFGSWTRWQPDVSRMDFPGPLAPGTVFNWVGGGAKITSRLEEVDESHRIVWTGRAALGLNAVHAWTIESVPTGTRVFTEESFAGILAGLLRGMLRSKLRKTLEEGLTALAAEVEARRHG